MKSIAEIVRHGLCIGCGVCAYSDAIDFTGYSRQHGQLIPVLKEGYEDDCLPYELCPGKGYNIIEESSRLYNSSYDLELGHCCNLYVGFSNDKQVLRSASSGGLISQVALFLLQRGIVDKVLTTIYEYTARGPRAKGVLTNSREDILASQGSKYCPVDFSEAIRTMKGNHQKLAIVGTPCHIAGIRNIQKHDESFAKNVVLTISNFCGGFKNYHNIRLIAKLKRIEAKEITFFRFRGGGQPGSMLINSTSGRTVEIPYPEYVGLNGLSKHLRCHLCVDATGELADIACGDAWLDRFSQDQNPWSVVITRSKRADDIVTCLLEDGVIHGEHISAEQIKLSQRENLYSKKVRQKSRVYLYQHLGYAVPSFDGGYLDNDVDLWTEAKVFLKHGVKELLERVGLFYFTRTLYKNLLRK